MLSDIENSLVGAKDNDDFSKKFYRSWVFWLCTVTINITASVFTPKDKGYLGLPIALCAIFISSMITIEYFKYLQRLKTGKPDYNHKNRSDT